MPFDAITNDGESTADMQPKAANGLGIYTQDARTNEKRRRPRQRHRLDGRTRQARRARHLCEAFTAALIQSGRELTPELGMRITKAAELVSIAEAARADMLRGKSDVLLDDLVRVTRLADASVRQLGMTTSPQPQAPTLDDYLADLGRGAA